MVSFPLPVTNTADFLLYSKWRGGRTLQSKAHIRVGLPLRGSPGILNPLYSSTLCLQQFVNQSSSSLAHTGSHGGSAPVICNCLNLLFLYLSSSGSSRLSSLMELKGAAGFSICAEIHWPEEWDAAVPCTVDCGNCGCAASPSLFVTDHLDPTRPTPNTHRAILFSAFWKATPFPARDRAPPPSTSCLNH